MEAPTELVSVERMILHLKCRIVEIMASTATTLSGGARLGGGLHKRHFGDSAKSRLHRGKLGGGRVNPGREIPETVPD